MALRRPIGVLPRALACAALAALAAACATGLAGDQFPQPTPTPTGLSEVDLLFNVAQDYPPQVTRITASDTFGPLNLVLTTGLTIDGRVGTGAALDPLPEGAIIRAVGTGVTSSAIEQTSNIDTVTGSYSLQLAPGTYDFIVTPRDSIDPQQPDRPISHFNGVAINASNTTQDFELPLGIAVNGLVRDGAGALVGPGFRIDAFDNGCPGRSQSATTDSMNSRFDIELPCSDLYTLRVTPPAGSAGYPQLEVQGVDVQGPMTQDIDYAPGFPPPAGTVQVTGTVNVGAGGPGIPNFNAMTIRATSVSLDDDPGDTGRLYVHQTQTTVDAGGAFTLQLLPGTYTVRILPEKDDPYSDKLLSDIVVGLVPIALPASDTRLVAKSEILGTLRDPVGRVVPGVIVRYEASATNGTGYTFSATSDAAGVYALSVNQGQYDVSLVPPADSGLVRGTSTADVPAAPEGPFDYSLEAGTTVTGTLFGDAEVNTPPVPAVLIQVLHPSTGESVGADDGFTTGDGSYLITVPPLRP